VAKIRWSLTGNYPFVDIRDLGLAHVLLVERGTVRRHEFKLSRASRRKIARIPYLSGNFAGRKFFRHGGVSRRWCAGHRRERFLVFSPILRGVLENTNDYNMIILDTRAMRYIAESMCQTGLLH
jgi:hypothetical protein